MGRLPGSERPSAATKWPPGPWTRSEPSTGRSARPQAVTTAVPTGRARRHKPSPRTQSEPKVSLKARSRDSRPRAQIASPQVRAGFRQQRDAFDVVRHREQVEGPQRRQRVAVLGEDRDVAGQRGGVAGDVRDRARRPVDDLLARPGAWRPRAAGRGRPGRTARRRVGGEHPVDRRRARRAPGRRAQVGARRRGAARRGRPSTATTRPGPTRVGEEARRTARRRRTGRAPAPPAAGRSSVEHGLDQDAAARRGAPARSRRRRRRRRAPLRRTVTRSDAAAPGARAPRSGSRRRAPRRGSGACASPRRPSGSVDVALPGAPPQAVVVAGHRLDRRRPRSRPAEPPQLLGTTAALSVALRRQRDVLEVAAAAEPGPGERARRRRPGPATASSTSTASPRQNRSPSVPSVISTTTRSPGSACRTKTTRLSGSGSRTTQ